MRSNRFVFLATCAAALYATPSRAQVRPLSLEGSLFGGVWEGDGRFDTGAVLGPRLQFNINRVFGVEATYGVVLSEDLADESDQLIHQLGVDGVLHLSAHALTPFITAGVGLVAIDGDVDFATNVGVGAKYYFTDLIAARIDIRGWFSADAEANPPGRSGDEFAHFEATAGITFQLFGDRDMDKDGVENHLDKCPTQPEDRDGFQDDDGCPDPDNDGDGIPDVDDKCPDQPEDMDGDADDDGCPDLDDDGDGVPNDADKCPAEPEDKDGFQDEDGCPDPDNDGDGILDAQDKCPDQPENKNGYQDEDGCPEGDADGDGIFDDADQCPDKPESFNGFQDADGCPDEIPEDLSAIFGIRTGVRFIGNKSDLSKADREDLANVAEVLKRYPDVVVDLVATAHTGNERAQEVSDGRAANARDYLVEQGVKPQQLRARGAGAAPLPDGPPEGARKDRLEISLVVDQAAKGR